MTYNFQPRFAAAVQSGKKHSTIRAPRVDGKLPVPGETLHFFTGMRTKSCRGLGKAPCKTVIQITIGESGILISGNRVPPHIIESIVEHDGFKHFPEMAAWFSKVHGLPFTGYLVEW